MEKHHVEWVNPRFLWPFSIAFTVYQRVCTAGPEDGGITEILPQPLPEESQGETTITVATVCAQHVSICPRPGAGGGTATPKKIEIAEMLPG